MPNDGLPESEVGNVQAQEQEHDVEQIVNWAQFFDEILLLGDLLLIHTSHRLVCLVNKSEPKQLEHGDGHLNEEHCENKLYPGPQLRPHYLLVEALLTFAEVACESRDNAVDAQ